MTAQVLMTPSVLASGFARHPRPKRTAALATGASASAVITTSSVSPAWGTTDHVR
jgi:hypothetical protein